LRVLTFNSHQPYLHLLASTMAWQVGIVLPRLPSGKIKSWDPRIRPLPDNARLFPSVDAALSDGSWDWVLTHNFHDLMESRAARVPKVFLVHGTLSGRIAQDRSTVDPKAYIAGLKKILKTERCRTVYISRLKERDWGIPGTVIRSAVDPAHYGGYHGTKEGVLQVCNHLRERGVMLGWETHSIVCGGIPHLVLGENRGIQESRVTENWEDLKEQYRSWRVYLFTAVHPFEDGYNLGMMEAMATGMPIATVAHPTSPIEDGVEGVTGKCAEELRIKILELLGNPERAASMGSAAREKLQREFPVADFRERWQSLADSL
jgi:hypothetical protein